MASLPDLNGAAQHVDDESKPSSYRCATPIYRGNARACPVARGNVGKMVHEQIFGADEQVRGRDLSDKGDVGPTRNAERNGRIPRH